MTQPVDPVDPTATTDGGVGSDSPPTPTVPVEQVVDRLVSKFTEAVDRVKTAPVAAPPAPTGPTAAERAEMAKRKYNEARERAVELAKEDPVAAFELLATTIQEAAPASGPVDVTADPSYRSLRAQAKRLASIDSTHRALIDRYSDEVDSIVATMPAPRQLDAAAWEEAVAVVRGRHFDELQREERAAWEREASESAERDRTGTPPRRAVTPVAGGARERSNRTPPAATLTPDQIGVARSFGITPERYAAQLAELGEPSRDGSYRNIPLMPPDSVPKPGQF